MLQILDISVLLIFDSPSNLPPYVYEFSLNIKLLPLNVSTSTFEQGFLTNVNVLRFLEWNAHFSEGHSIIEETNWSGAKRLFFKT